MSKIAEFPPVDGVAGELCGALVDCVLQYEGRLSLAATIGAMEIAKAVIMENQLASDDD